MLSFPLLVPYYGSSETHAAAFETQGIIEMSKVSHEFFVGEHGGDQEMVLGLVRFLDVESVVFNFLNYFNVA